MSGSIDHAVSARGLSKTYRLKLEGKSSFGYLANSLFPPLFKNHARNFSALNDISFDLQKGDSMGVIGLNGAGKSTLLQILSQVVRPSSGEFQTEGKLASLLELGSGFNPEFTGRENIYLNASLFGLRKNEVDEKYDSIVEFSEIEDFIDQPVKTYSSGMSLRLAFSVLVHVDADILLIDEALAVGDSAFVQKCMRFIRSFKEKGTLILVTHDHLAVQSICEKCLWLEKGKVRSFGSSKTIIDEYVSYILCKDEAADASGKGCGETPDEKSLDASGLEFGKGGARVRSLKLINRDTQKDLSVISGNERVVLTIEVSVTEFIEFPVIGFIVRNRHGQDLFSDNTLSSATKRSFKGTAGEVLKAQFEFVMPVLKKGDYSMSVAVSQFKEGEFVPLHWVNDALFFESLNDSFFRGLVGIPMETVTLSK